MSDDRGEGRSEAPSDDPSQDGRGGPGDAAPDRPEGWRGLPYSRKTVLLIAVIIVAFYLISTYAVGTEQMGCTEVLTGRTQWSQATAGARLTDLWSRGSEGFDVTDAELTHLTVAWSGDGSMIHLELQGKTSVGLQITVSGSSPSGGRTMTVYSDSAALGTSTTTTGSISETTGAPAVVARPLLAQVLASIDTVGFEGLKTATTAVLDEEEGLILEMEADGLSQPGLTVAEYAGGSVVFAVTDGDLAPVEGAVTVSSLAPAQVFSLSKAQIRGSGASGIPPPLSYLFMR